MVCSLVSIYFESPQLEIQKSKLYKTLDYWFRDMLNFDFLERDLGIFSLLSFVYDFLRKMFSCYINWPNIILWLPLLREIFGNMCIAIVCFPGCDVINLEIKLIFLIKPFSLHDQKVKTKI